ncbi:MAG: hypothetical protein ACRDTM_16895, partial [Micromonosporaceae bacterium]
MKEPNGGAMRRTSDTEFEVALGATDQARHRAARADTPAADIVLPPHAVPAAEVPPTVAAGTVSRATRGLRRVSAHTQLGVIAGLVVVASIATGLVVTHGARQLDVGPGQRTTPYLAVAPSGP